MSQEQPTPPPHKKRRIPIFILFGCFVLLVILSVFGSYFTRFEGLPTDRQIWGVFGDFIGGVLNPLLSFFALVALLYTIRLQNQDLGLTREELKATREVHREQKENFKTQLELEVQWRILKDSSDDLQAYLQIQVPYGEEDEEESAPLLHFVGPHRFDRLFELVPHPDESNEQNHVVMLQCEILAEKLLVYVNNIFSAFTERRRVIYEEVELDDQATHFLLKHQEYILDLADKGYMDPRFKKLIKRASSHSFSFREELG